MAPPFTTSCASAADARLSEELFLSPKTIEGYVRNVFTKLGLEQGEREHRRVLAVLQFLRWK